MNALLGDKFSEVSPRRTTAGINHFRVFDQATPSIATAETIHDVISKDNQSLRSSTEIDHVPEKIFDIHMDKPICEMRKDTKLTIIDIPGINDSESGTVYKNYVASNWDTFDCVVVVTDVLQGVNTVEQVELLKFVKENNYSKKPIPTIILGNKLDDPKDTDTLTLVKETREKTIEIFGKHCSEQSLEKLLKIAEQRKSANTNNTSVGDRHRRCYIYSCIRQECFRLS